MKELEKTKRISIAAVISILAVIIGLLTYKRPQHLYTINTKTALENITKNNLVNLNDLSYENSVLIDIRNEFEYQKGHIYNAINIQAANILLENNKGVFEEIKEQNKTAVLYGSNPNEAIAPFMVLNQLGFDNLKILSVENSYTQDSIITKNIEVEKSQGNINAFIEASEKKAAKLLAASKKPKPIVKKTVKKVIPKKKKKKMPVEGGC